MGIASLAGLFKQKGSFRTLFVAGLAGSLSTGPLPVTLEGWAARLGLAGMGVLGSVAGGLFTSKVEHALEEGDGLNGHLNRVTGRTVSACVRLGAGRAEGAEAEQLLRIAARIDERHEPGGPDRAGLEGAGPDEVAAFFENPEGFAEQSVLTAREWLDYLRLVSKELGIDSGMLEPALPEIAAELETDFVRSLYHELQEDFADKGQAFAGMLLRLFHRTLSKLEDLEQGQQQLLDRTAGLEGLLQGLPAALAEIRAGREDLDADVKSIVAVLPEVRAALTDLAARSGRIEEVALDNNRLLRELAARPDDPRAAGEAAAQRSRRRRLGVMTPLIGRDDEVERIGARLEGGDRLVTMVGPPGTGKTALAKKVAHELGGKAADGCYYVEYRTLQDGGLVPQEAAEQFGLTVPERTPPIDVLTEFLWDKHVLLVIDNCEHVLEECSALIESLLSEPGLQVVATSRKAFGKPWESVFEVEPLGLPQGDSLEELEGNESAALFVRRARMGRGQGGFELTADNAPAVGRICRAVAGLPLAIELAAAQVSDSDVAELADDFWTRMAGIEGSSPADRHGQTMVATIQRSYDGLTPAEQRAFRRLAVFDGGWTDASAEAVLGSGARTWIASLRDHSLVEQDETYRRWYLEPIRQFAEGLLGEEELAEARDAHRDWHTLFAQATTPRLQQGDKAEAIELLELEHDNLRRAVHWSTGRGAALAALELGAALWRFWEVRGYLTEGRAMLAEVLAVEAGAAAETERGWRLRAGVLSGDATIAYRQGRPTETRALSEQALQLATRAGDREGASVALSDLGIAQQVMGELEPARETYARCLKVFEELGNRRQTAVSNYNLGSVLFRLEDFALARVHLERGLNGFLEIGDLDDAAYPLTVLGLLACAEGDLAAARERIERGLELRADSPRGRGESRDALGVVALAAGELDQAGEELKRAWRHRREVGDRRGMAVTLDSLAALADERGQVELSVRTRAASDALRSEIQVVRSPAPARDLDRRLAAARASAGDAACDGWLSAGRALSPKDAAAAVFEA